MASGTLGAASLTPNIDTVLYTVPVSKIATVNVAFVNRGIEKCYVNLGVTNTSLNDSSYLEYEAEIPAKGVLERTAIVIGAGEKIIVRTNGASVTARGHGFEE